MPTREDYIKADNFHPSHCMSRWKSKVVTLIDTPRFGRVRKCKNCGAEQMESVAGFRLDKELRELCVEKKPSTEQDSKIKPHINDVALAFHNYHERVRRVSREYLRHPKKYREELSDTQQSLKDKLESMGLASLIDWTQE